MATHRDEINNMSNEELAKKLYDCKNVCVTQGNCNNNNTCVNNIIEWLNMEVEE